MMLNISELRKDYSEWPDLKSRIICQLLDIVEAVEYFREEVQSVIGKLPVNTDAEADRLNEAIDRLEKLLEDVEVGDG